MPGWRARRADSAQRLVHEKASERTQLAGSKVILEPDQTKPVRPGLDVGQHALESALLKVVGDEVLRQNRNPTTRNHPVANGRDGTQELMLTK